MDIDVDHRVADLEASFGHSLEVARNDVDSASISIVHYKNAKVARIPHLKGSYATQVSLRREVWPRSHFQSEAELQFARTVQVASIE
jgi:hypothetical protein